MKYSPHKIEEKWQKVWETEKTFSFNNDSTDPTFYVLDMFPYPSAEGLHIGHPEGYTATDIIARYQRMRGLNVLHPMGWDAFGLPAENFAIKSGVHPAQTTASSIDNFRKQIKRLGFSYDWSREISTADPDYYKWTQWLFLYLYKKGLAYQKEAPVNWCPGCKTVLANEQVVAGECERCGSKVVQKNLKQWFFKITDYNQRLLDDLESVDWPEGIKAMQRNWIGRSEGVLLQFSITNSQSSISVFTTRPDTLFGATYMVLSPEHELVSQLADKLDNKEEVEEYIKKAGSRTDLERMTGVKDKTGVELKGVSAVNPATKEEIPIFIADYVLMGYGTGAIMAVPAHDERDFEFAKKFGLKIVEVIGGGELPHTGEGKMVNSEQFNGISSKAARGEIIKFVGGEQKINYKLRDWLISRQRYWGAPIPIIYCDDCGAQGVPESDIPVVLPTDVDFNPTGESPLASSKEFHNVKCPKCSGRARRESDTMDTFVDSSWYFLRYIDNQNQEEIFNKEKINTVMPTDLYIGGAEHAVLHLLYSRFITKTLADGKMVNFNEPFLKLRNQGMVLGSDGHKISKSKGNGVNPDNVIEEFGADSLRLYEMFMGPLEDEKPWNTKGIIGMFRFLTKVWNLGEELEKLPSREKIDETEKLRRLTHQTIKKVEGDIVGLKFNTAISALMVFLKSIEHEKSYPAFRTFLLLLSSFAPHISAELWERLGYGKYIWEEQWPEVQDKYLEISETNLVVQVNGKVRDTILLPAGMSKDELVEAAKKLAKVATYLEGKEIKNTVVVPDKLVNFVIN